jgi:hypothetical protein
VVVVVLVIMAGLPGMALATANHAPYQGADSRDNLVGVVGGLEHEWGGTRHS